MRVIAENPQFLLGNITYLTWLASGPERAEKRAPLGAQALANQGPRVVISCCPDLAALLCYS